MILPQPNNVLLHHSPPSTFPLRTNVAPKLLEAPPPQSQSFGFRVSYAIVLRRGGEEVRGVVGERRFREIGSWQLGFTMETRRLARVPRLNPKGHCLWWCSHPLLNSEYTPRLIKDLEGIKRLKAMSDATKPSLISELPSSKEVVCGGYHTCVLTNNSFW